MAEFAETSGNIVHPFDYWGQPEQAERANAMLAHLRQDEYRFMRDAGAWADLLLQEEALVYEAVPVVAPLASGTSLPDKYSRADPTVKRRGGYHEITPEEAAAPNMFLYLGLDALVKERDPEAFVAFAAHPEQFDPYWKNEADEQGYRSYYFVVGRRGSESDPSETAERALLIRSGYGYTQAYLAPRYDEVGSARRTEILQAQQRERDAWQNQKTAAETLGTLALRLENDGRIERFADAFSARFEADAEGNLPLSARWVLQHIWIPNKSGAGHTTPRTIEELLEHAEDVQSADIYNAFAALYPNDTPEALMRRVSGDE